jgi:Fe2+ transport system protein B
MTGRRTTAQSLTEQRGKVLVPKAVGWIIAVLVIVWIVANPARAGNDVHTWINDIVSFFSHLTNGGISGN